MGPLLFLKDGLIFLKGGALNNNFSFHFFVQVKDISKQAISGINLHRAILFSGNRFQDQGQELTDASVATLVATHHRSSLWDQIPGLVILDQECHWACPQAMVQQVPKAPILLFPVATQAPDRVPPSHVTIQSSFNLLMFILLNLSIFPSMDVSSLQVLFLGEDAESPALIRLAHHYLSILHPFL